MSTHRKGDLVQLLYDTLLWERATVGVVVSDKKGAVDESLGVSLIYDVLVCGTDGRLRRVSIDSYWITGIED